MKCIRTLLLGFLLISIFSCSSEDDTSITETQVCDVISQMVDFTKTESMKMLSTPGFEHTEVFVESYFQSNPNIEQYLNQLYAQIHGAPQSMIDNCIQSKMNELSNALFLDWETREGQAYSNNNVASRGDCADAADAAKDTATALFAATFAISAGAGNFAGMGFSAAGYLISCEVIDSNFCNCLMNTYGVAPGC